MNITRRIAILLLTALIPAWTTATAMPQPSFHTKGTPTGKPTGPLKPGEYWWAPVVSPTGPVMVLVSVPLQTIQVYRNGILVGRSSVSTGTKGHSTPSGVFTILEKKETHRSTTYQGAPMPHMQRLTWSGIAMHSGQLPGYPAGQGRHRRDRRRQKAATLLRCEPRSHARAKRFHTRDAQTARE